MPAANDQAQLVGMFKDVWKDNIVEAWKFLAPIAARVPFEQAAAVGNKYHVPVDLTLEGGFTYAAYGVTPTLIGAIAGFTGDAQIQGSEIYGQAQVTYGSVMASATSQQAVKDATRVVVRRLSRGGVKRLEIDMLHGGIGIGVANAISGTLTTRVITISAPTWSAGIWAGMEGAQLDARRTVTTYADTLINTNAAIVITAVNVATREISVSGNATDLTALDTYAATGTALMFFHTSSPVTSMAGLHEIAANTGLLFNINAAQYALWGGNQYPNFGTPSLEKVLEALSLTASFGGQGLRSTLICSPKFYEVLNSNEAALRRYDSSYKRVRGENGFEGLLFQGQTGELEVLPHMFQKDGQALLCCLDEVHRIGGQDFSFVIGTGEGEKIVLHIPNSPAGEMRLQSQQAIYAEAPRHMVNITGVTYP